MRQYRIVQDDKNLFKVDFKFLIFWLSACDDSGFSWMFRTYKEAERAVKIWVLEENSPAPPKIKSDYPKYTYLKSEDLI